MPSPSKPPAKRRKQAAARPFFRFYHSEALREKTLAVLSAIEKAEDGTPHRPALADIVVELTSCGMNYFYLEALKLAKAGFLVEQSASLGISASNSMMAPVIRTIINRMDHAQLVAVCKYMRHLMK